MRLAIFVTVCFVSRALLVCCELVLDSLCFDAHRDEPLLELCFLLDHVDRVEASEDRGPLSILATCHTNCTQQARAFLMRLLVHSCGGEIGHQTNKTSLKRSPRFSCLPLELLEARLDQLQVAWLVADEMCAECEPGIGCSVFVCCERCCDHCSDLRVRDTVDNHVIHGLLLLSSDCLDADAADPCC